MGRSTVRSEAWRPDVVVLSCEHGGNEVPARYLRLFERAGDMLDSHRGWDIGALGVARRFAEMASYPLIACTFTRLLVEPNRSPDSGNLFSVYTKDLDDETQAAIKRDYYDRHRDSVERTIADAIAAGRRVLHVGVHSCTDQLDGHLRDLDVSLLFDPDRASERDVCEAWNPEIARLEPAWRLPFNQPYKGTDDGLTTWLRGRLPADMYAGVEVEVRQGLILEPPAQRRVGQVLADGLRSALKAMPKA
ncbi:MAG: N-formylglutamate amidohydrolase [Phycisphaerales bacterium JB064]